MFSFRRNSTLTYTRDIIFSGEGGLPAHEQAWAENNAGSRNIHKSKLERNYQCAKRCDRQLTKNKSNYGAPSQINAFPTQKTRAHDTKNIESKTGTKQSLPSIALTKGARTHPSVLILTILKHVGESAEVKSRTQPLTRAALCVHYRR